MINLAAAAVLVRELMEDQVSPTPARPVRPAPRPARQRTEARPAGRLVPAAASGARRVLT